MQMFVHPAGVSCSGGGRLALLVDFGGAAWVSISLGNGLQH